MVTKEINCCHPASAASPSSPAPTVATSAAATTAPTPVSEAATPVLRDTQIRINLTRIGENTRLIDELIGPDVAIMAVIKANGYGHGAVAIAPTILENGADYLAVATLTEALQLREALADAPLFILGHTPDRLLSYVVTGHITQTIFTLEQARILNDLAEKQNTTARVHVKVDTGMHRLGGVPSEEFAEEICQMCHLPHLEVEGIYSHLALANDEENEKQYQAFCQFIEKLENRGCTFRYKHIADSIATVDFPQYRMNMVRPGALLYGMRCYHKGFLPVEQALTFRTAISQLHSVPAGEGVGYDYLWRASRDSLVATLPFGYADGYPRSMWDKGYVLINGTKAPLVGVICMDQCVVDVTDVPDVCCGMEAIIYGDGTDGSMTINDAALLLDTNRNDLIARLLDRPPRVYLR
jgi:alanine racemase